jgi:hypothetical protein
VSEHEQAEKRVNECPDATNIPQEDLESAYGPGRAKAFGSKAAEIGESLEAGLNGFLIVGAVITPDPSDIALLAFLRGATRVEKLGNGVWRSYQGEGKASRVLTNQQVKELEDAIRAGRVKTKELKDAEAAAKKCKPKCEPKEPAGAEHKKNVRKSTEEKHQEGQSRKQRDQGGEKGDERRR